MAEPLSDRAIDGSLPSGALLFARYAYPPNVLGYCGGDDPASLADHRAAAVSDAELVERCREFEGAWPYLELIARSAGIPDPLDRRVVEAYWLGGGLLDAVRPRPFADSLESRFRSRTGRSEWPWLFAKPGDGAQPHHSFHVLEVLPRVGLLREGRVQDVVDRMELCLIRPALVTDVDAAGDGLRVLARGLTIHDGHLVETEPRTERLHGWVDARSPDAPAAGDWVTSHWGRACERIGPRARARLEAVTRAAISSADRTT